MPTPLKPVEKSTRRAMAHGAGWMVAMRMFDRGLGVISTIVLARLLVPADYGLIGMAAIFSEILFLLAAFGFDSALIQKDAPGPEHFNTVWTLNVIFGLAVGGGLILLAPVAATYFAEPRLEAVMLVLALGPVLNGFANVGVVMFRKELQFQRDALLMALRRIVGFAVGLAAAFWLRSYWALVLGTLASAAAGLVLSYVMHPYRPRFDLSARRELLGFSFWLFLNSVIRFANIRLLDFIIAKHAGPHALGIFSTANDISSLPTTELSAPINRALFPGYAKLQNDDAILRQTVLDVFAILGVVAIPAGIGIASIAPLLVPVMLGPRWLETIPLIQILAIAGVIAVLQNNSYLVYLAKGRPRMTTWIAGSFAVVQALLAFLLLPRYGVIGVAMGMLLARTIYIPIEVGMLLYTLKIKPGTLISVLIRPLISGLVMAWVVIQVSSAFSGASGLEAILALGVSVLTGAFIFTVILILAWRIAGAPQGGEMLFLQYFPFGGRVLSILFKILYIRNR